MTDLNREVSDITRNLTENRMLTEEFSDVMARRDNYFHSCWMRLKQQRPDLYELMTQCELYIAGLLPPEEEPDADDPDDTIL